MTSPPPAEALLAQPRGFCAGVERAIDTVEKALARYGAPVYVLHEIVHNRRVLADLREQGAEFVDRLDQVPEGAVTIFSAHGVSDEVVETATKRRLKVIDATCPLVTKVHLQAQKYVREGRQIILVGHEGHPEVEGTRGRIEGDVVVLCSIEEVRALEVEDPERLAYVTQTTLSVDDTREVVAALKERFPSIRGPELQDICYATQNRQNAVKGMSERIDVLLVVGSQNSSNSNRLVELGRRHGKASYLIDGPDDVDPRWFAAGVRIGITAGASAPEVVVREVCARLHEMGLSPGAVEMEGRPETTTFRLPDELESFSAT